MPVIQRPEEQVNASVSRNPMSAGWIMLCGVVIAGAAVKEVVARIAESPVAITPRRPSIGTVMVMGFLLKDAIGRIGSDALQLPAGR
jgi:hypothetical protein